MATRFSRALYAVYANPLATGEEAMHAWYEDVHVPDSLALGLFTCVRRYRANDPASRARFLTLWSAVYTDLDAALAAVRPVAESLRAKGRIHVVQEVVFQHFLFLEGVDRESAAPPPASLTTLHACWARPETTPRFFAWLAALAPGEAPLAHYASIARYAVSAGGKGLALLESEADAARLAAAWRGLAEPGLPPFGPPTPIFRGGSPAPGPPPETPPSDADLARWKPAWAAQWTALGPARTR